MAVEIDPITGKKTLTYYGSEDYTKSSSGNFFSSPVETGGTLWDYRKQGRKISELTGVLSWIPQDTTEISSLLNSEAGKKLREVNTEFASYYQAYMQEENQRRNIAKAFGVQNTVLTGAGTITGAEASKKGTALGGAI